MSDDRFTIPGFHGTLLQPGDDGYDDARRVFNAMIDRRPMAIARCTNAAEVGAAVTAARASGVPPSVYGGGHSVTGSAVVDGGICIDLRGLNHVTVDPATSTARTGGGATGGEFDAATTAHGLAVTVGRVSSTRRCSSCSTPPTPAGCATTGRVTSSPSCRTPRSRRWSSSAPTKSHR